MLFVNEEFEESQPVFSEPKKVRPKTDDEMARRIKSMFGEYLHEKNTQEAGFTESLMEEEKEKSPVSEDIVQISESVFQEDLIEKNVSEAFAEKNDCISTNEFAESADNANIKAVLLSDNEVSNNVMDDSEKSTSDTSASSRRCSLKRQCKERISLLDYNPMFVIRTKRAKGSTSGRTKSTENIEDLNRNVGTSEQSPSIPVLSDHMEENVGSGKDKIPTLKRYPDLLRNNFSEVPDEDTPPLLNSVLTSPLADNKLDDDFNEEFFKEKDIYAFVSDESSHSQVKLKRRKQSKKKKKSKVLYESLPVSDAFSTESALSPCAQESNGQSVDSKIGSCQITNGIIKIRLSKLPDNKKEVSENKYEVTICEINPLPTCKPLSVPLSPLAPSVYSAYCSSNKQKIHSNKVKHSVRKKRKNGQLKKEVECVSEDITQCEDSTLSDCHELSKGESDFKANTVTSEAIEVENITANESVESSKNSKATFNVSNCSEIVKPDIGEQNTEITPRTDVENLSSEPTILPLENDSISLKNRNLSNTCDSSKIMCSINLALIDRLPVKTSISNCNDQFFTVSVANESHTAHSLKDSTYGNLENKAGGMQIIFEGKSRSNNIKKEIFTPPADIANMELNSLENRNSPDPAVKGADKDNFCQNLTPTYSFDIPSIEDKCNNISCDNQTDMHQESGLCSSNNELLSGNANEDPSKLINPMFTCNPHLNKVKIEVPDAILSNHERWNEYKEYKWCRDFSDVSYRNGSMIFKEQITCNVANHRLWQDPELKKQYSSEYYLNEAKKLKHQADKEIDRMVQAMKYLEAVLYFILTGNAMEHSYIDTDRVHTMYKETLTLIRFISSKFQKLHNASCRNIDNKLTVLSLRCQSLLYLKMYQLRRDEIRYLHRGITTILKSESGSSPDQVSPPHLQSYKQNTKQSQVSPSHLASPCSLTPSPAESVASVSSQSSGYNSSEISWNSSHAINDTAQIQYDVYSDAVNVSRNKYKMLLQQSAFLSNLHLCHDLWEHADYLSSKEHSREFFLELDEECGCLSLHSPFSALVHYVRKGLYKLKDGT